MGAATGMGLNFDDSAVDLGDKRAESLRMPRTHPATALTCPIVVRAERAGRRFFAEQGHMCSPSFVHWGAIAFGAALLLGFHGAFAEDIRGPPRLVDCTRDGISGCYTRYDMVFQWPELQRNDEGQFNENAYRRACSALNETSSCYVGFNRCSESVRSNFTRREEGYKAFRSLVCDSEAFQGAITSRSCADAAKMRECMLKQHGNLRERHLVYEEILCRWIVAERVCYERSLVPSCPLSLEAAKAFGTRTLDTEELMHDCKRMYPQDARPNNSDVTEGGRNDGATHGSSDGNVVGK